MHRIVLFAGCRSLLSELTVEISGPEGRDSGLLLSIAAAMNT